MKSKYININSLKSVFIIAVISFLSSCTGYDEAIVPISIDVDNVPPVIVINGVIEKDKTGWVQISYSLDIDTTISASINYEKNAIVTLTKSDGTKEQFKYQTAGVYTGSVIRGQVGESYKMDIEVNGKTYTATSKMFAESGFKDAWVNSVVYTKAGITTASYDAEFILNDPSTTRNRYLLQWRRNGWHDVRRDWCIDDDRVVNVNEGLRLFNPTTKPVANEYTEFRVAEVDKLTYDYYNLYEKIVRGLIGVASQTPYNPVSNFAQGSMGNFRAVAFSSIIVLTPPDISVAKLNNDHQVAFNLNTYFKKYNLYWSTSKGVTKSSKVIKNIDFKTLNNKNATYNFINPSSPTLFYKIEVEDAAGNVSILSPEATIQEGSTGGSNGIANAKATGGTGEITLTWDKANGATIYYLYWSLKSGVSEKDNLISNITSPYVHKGLTKGTTYYYKIFAKAGSTVFMSEEISAVAK
jgi:hypothetical protein